MTGPEHYREAEKLLVNVGNAKVEHPFAARWVEMADIHATLALAAATALAATDPDSHAWADVAGT